MALTAYCKKCNQEVAPGDICPRCGTKLAKTAIHAAWTVERRPVTDWMCWNAVMRWLLPAGVAVMVLALILEGLSGGAAAVEQLLTGGFPLTVGLMLGVVILLVFLALLLQGKEIMEYTVDSRGVHAARYLPEPTGLKLIVRGKSPALLRAVSEENNSLLCLEERDLPWREVKRVQLWPEKCYILFYSPAWWLRIPVRCTPFSWEDALFYVRDKLGKKKAVELPEHLRVQAEKKPAARRTAGRTVPAVRSAAPERAAEPVPASAPEWEEPMPGEDESFPGEPGEVPAEAGEQITLDLDGMGGEA